MSNPTTGIRAAAAAIVVAGLWLAIRQQLADALHIIGGSGGNTLQKALQFDFDRVIPGHGPVMTKQDLARWMDSFIRVRSKISQLKREGKSKEEAGSALNIEEFGWKASPLWTRSFPGLFHETPLS